LGKRNSRKLSLIKEIGELGDEILLPRIPRLPRLPRIVYFTVGHLYHGFVQVYDIIGIFSVSFWVASAWVDIS
jgi:hypothetical protein